MILWTHIMGRHPGQRWDRDKERNGIKKWKNWGERNFKVIKREE
jgi:hypothetical protein